jgi:hypothetical protein
MSTPTQATTPKPTKPKKESSFKKIAYGIFHTICAIFAIFLSFKCNGGFSFGSLLIACCCPYIYIIYIYATTSSTGFCGLTSSYQPNNMMLPYGMPGMMMPNYGMPMQQYGMPMQQYGMR